MQLFFFSLLGLCFFFSAEIAQAQDTKKWLKFTEEGKASFYPDSRDGNRTRSGEVYDHNQMESAHKHLPFGAVIEVLNLENGKVAHLRINDRPYTDSRILDMTSAAAEILGFKSEKIQNIRLKVVALGVLRKEKKAANQSFTDETQKKFGETVKVGDKIGKEFAPVGTYLPDGQSVRPQGFGIQLAAFPAPTQALVALHKAKKHFRGPAYLQAGWHNGQPQYRVLFGAYADRELAESQRQHLRSRYPGCFVKQHL
jgi:rare lipoprotein A